MIIKEESDEEEESKTLIKQGGYGGNTEDLNLEEAPI